MTSPASLVASAPRKQIIRVEGPDDLGVMVAVLKHLGMDRRVQVKPSGGLDQLLAGLSVQLKESDLTELGIVLDADADVQARWNAVRAILGKAGFTGLPRRIATRGLVVSGSDHPTVGVWIMPDNGNSGAVEHFVRSLMPASDKLWPTAEATIRTVMSVDQRFIAEHEMKATVHTWLAWQEEPGRPMGQAITKRFLDPASPQANPLYDWLQRVYGP